MNIIKLIGLAFIIVVIGLLGHIFFKTKYTLTKVLVNVDLFSKIASQLDYSIIEAKISSNAEETGMKRTVMAHKEIYDKVHKDTAVLDVKFFEYKTSTHAKNMYDYVRHFYDDSIDGIWSQQPHGFLGGNANVYKVLGRNENGFVARVDKTVLCTIYKYGGDVENELNRLLDAIAYNVK